MRFAYLYVAVVLCSVRVVAQQPEDPFANRPVCASHFLNSDWQLSFKQRSCDWIQNRMFSTTSALAAAWSAGYQQVTEKSSDLEKGTGGFTTRFATNFAESAAKSTGAYLGGMVSREDPRPAPPFLALSSKPHPHGFFK